MQRFLAAAAGLAPCLAAAAADTPAGYDTFSYTQGAGGQSFSFTVPSSPQPTNAVGGLGFRAAVDNIMENGAPATFADGVVYFYNTDFRPETLQMDDGAFSLRSPQLYSGGEGSPTSLTGTYDNIYNEYGARSGTLTVASGGGGGGPEPSTWALMMVGVFGAGTARCRRRGVAAAALAA